MKRSNWFVNRFDVINAILIALVSLSTAFSVWRTNVIGSNAEQASRQRLASPWWAVEQAAKSGLEPLA